MKKHGQTSRKGSTPAYYSWLGMKARCLSKSHKAYNNYGGRGIKICDKWKAYISFSGKQIHLGYFTDEKEAALAYNRKALTLYGDYVHLNVVPK